MHSTVLVPRLDKVITTAMMMPLPSETLLVRNETSDTINTKTLTSAPRVRPMGYREQSPVLKKHPQWTEEGAEGGRKPLSRQLLLEC